MWKFSKYEIDWLWKLIFREYIMHASDRAHSSGFFISAISFYLSSPAWLRQYFFHADEIERKLGRKKIFDIARKNGFPFSIFTVRKDSYWETQLELYVRTCVCI